MNNDYWRADENRRTVLQELFSVLSRVIPAAFFSFSCIAFWNNFLATGKLTSLFWMVSEGLVVLLLIFRKESISLSKKPWDWVVAIAGSFFIVLVRPTDASQFLESMGFTLQLLGTLFELYGKAILGRSFGIVAANRGIVIKGPYRIVRHPIYLGYMITHIGFLISNWSARNIAVYVVSYFFQIARIYSEERLLLQEESYREYCREVRYRLVPGIF